jgi:hypothetical protein
MTESILTSTKKILGIEEAYEAFDLDIVTHINSAFSTLTQIGVGPPQGFMIEDKTAVWSDLLGSDPRLLAVKQYVYLRVRFIFDPPGSSYAVDAMSQQIKEQEWRLNTFMEQSIWTDPDPDPLPDDEIFTPDLDGGTP